MNSYEAGKTGENILKNELVRLCQGGCIDHLWRSQTLCDNGTHFQMDFVVFAFRIGIVVLESKYWKGNIHVHRNAKWEIYLGDHPIRPLKNASDQVLRATACLHKLLSKDNAFRLWKIPIVPAVVMTYPDSEIVWPDNKAHYPQTDVMKTHELESWIEAKSHHTLTSPGSEWMLGLKKAMRSYLGPRDKNPHTNITTCTRCGNDYPQY